MKALGIILTIFFIRTTTTVEMNVVKPIDNTPTHMLMKRNKKPTFTKKKTKEIMNTLNKYKTQ